MLQGRVGVLQTLELEQTLPKCRLQAPFVSYLPPDPPILLSGNEVVPRIQTGAAGQAWFSLDKNCALHYHLMFSGMDRGRKNLMTAELQGFADYGEVPQPYDEHVHFLRSFEGETVRMHVPDVYDLSP